MTVSLIPANIEYLAAAVQTDKDTPADAPQIAWVLEDESLDPGVQILTTAETDQSAQQGDRIVVGAQPGGTFRKYLRPNEEDFFLNALLGLTQDTPGSPDVHVSNIDPDAPFFTPYLTIWQVWPGSLAIKYDGCRIGQGVYTCTPGQGASSEYTVVALAATYLDSEPDISGLLTDELPFTWADLAVSLGGDHNGIVQTFSLTISRNTGRFEGDNGLKSLDVPNGLVAITGSAEIAFEDDALTRAANTGDPTGTDLSTTIYETELEFDFSRAGGDEEVDFDLATVQLSSLRTAPKTDGSPATTTFNFNTKRVPDAVDTLVVATVKNAFVHADRNPPS